jgi:hypothetical protein
MLVYVGTAFNNSTVEVTPTSVRVSELGLSGTITLNGVVLLNVGQTVQSAIDATGAQAPYYFLSVSKQSNGGK